MTSVRIKDFLINLLIALVLAVPILLGLYFFRDKITSFFSKKKSQNPKIIQQKGPSYKIETSSGKQLAFAGTIKEILDEGIVIEKDSESEEIIINEKTLIFKFDSPPENMSLGSKKESLRLNGNNISDIMNIGFQVEIPEVDSQGTDYIAKTLMVFSGK